MDTGFGMDVMRYQFFVRNWVMPVHYCKLYCGCSEEIMCNYRYNNGLLCQIILGAEWIL